MHSNSSPAAFWLTWHLLRDQKTLAQASREVAASYFEDNCDESRSDLTKLCTQPLLQSIFAEILRKYATVHLLRRPVFEDTSIENIKIPKNQLVVIPTAMAHMDERN